MPRYRTEKPSKSPPPPPPRRSFPSSHGLTTTRTGEVVVTSKKDSAFIKIPPPTLGRGQVHGVEWEGCLRGPLETLWSVPLPQRKWKEKRRLAGGDSASGLRFLHGKGPGR